MNANEIRQHYLDFMQKKGHRLIAPAPIVLEDDPTTLFTGAGMQPLMPYLLGEAHPSGKRLCDSQPCLRMQDIDEVGDARHTTTFEMLGNWSLGDYFKKTQIENIFEFLTQVIGLDPSKLYVSCFMGSKKYNIPRDDEAAEIWQAVFASVGIEAKIAEIGSAKAGAARGIKAGERIFFYDDNENWWSRSGGIEDTPLGDPCGPDSEIFYDFGEELQDEAKYGKAHPASDGARFMEIGNQVFMQYRRNQDGSFSELKHKNIDFGAGLERIAAASIDSHDVFKVSSLAHIVAHLENLTGKNYQDYLEDFRIIADHLRGAYLLTAQGLTPSNKRHGYCLRRLIRRAILKSFNLGVEHDFLAELIPVIAEDYATLPSEILGYRDKVLDVLNHEEKAFRRSLTRGLKELQKLQQDGLTGKELFKLKDTYGFPLELSIEEASNRGIKLSADWQSEFDAALQQQRERSQTATKGLFKGGLADHDARTLQYHSAAHLLLAALRQIISPDITQKGSNITSERLRFDFNLDHKMTAEEKQRVEDQVNAWIKADLPIECSRHGKDEARYQLKATGAFWDKYPDPLTVYTVGDPAHPVSCEVCGGPHVKRTGELPYFKIKKEESVAAGLRRIKAVFQQSN